MNPLLILELAQAASVVLNTIAELKATADAETQAQVDALLAPAQAKFTTDAATAEADLTKAAG